MSEQQVKMVILSTDDLDESIRFYSETLGMSLKFRDGAHFAALDGGPVTLHWQPRSTIPFPARSWSASRPTTSTRGQGRGRQWRRHRERPLRRRPRTPRGGL